MAKDVAPQGLVAGKYRLTTLIGRGGMGSVWEGTHASLGTHVAVKFIESEYAESPEARNRFENEARAAARLRSKHVVEVYDHGVTDDGRPFIVMEYLRGEPLDKRLERVGRIAARETARLVMQVCRALHKAHAAGIVHRDLKPENVFLVWDEEDGADVVKVVDFGIAKFTDNQLGNSSATRTGSVLGTPYYMSPEQARGLRTVDHRSDLWSVGVIAYRCIVGELPFEGEAVGDLLVKLCTAPLPVPSQLAPDVPPGFDAWFTKALSREPEGRFSTAAELAESLGAVCGLPARGAYSTGDMPASSFVPPGTPTPAIVPGPGSLNPPAVLPVTPYSSADRSGQNVAQLAGSSSSTLQMGTGAPTTQTPTPSASRSTGTIIAAVAAAIVVLGVGIGVAYKLLSPASVAEVAPSLPGVQPVAPPALEPARVVDAPSAGTAVAPAVAPAVEPPSASASPAASTSGVGVAASSGTAPKPPRPMLPPSPPPRPAKPPGNPAGPDVGF